MSFNVVLPVELDGSGLYVETLQMKSAWGGNAVSYNQNPRND